MSSSPQRSLDLFLSTLVKVTFFKVVCWHIQFWFSKIYIRQSCWTVTGWTWIHFYFKFSVWGLFLGFWLLILPPSPHTSLSSVRICGLILSPHAPLRWEDSPWEVLVLVSFLDPSLHLTVLKARLPSPLWVWKSKPLSQWHWYLSSVPTPPGIAPALSPLIFSFLHFWHAGDSHSFLQAQLCF